MTEFFGPVLGVMRVNSLSEAIAIVNETGFGLTSGLESLDDREQAEWLDGIRAGNLYINRPTTGAIVQRQPFGGMGKSAFGPGIKAGGPNYVAQMMRFADQLPETPRRGAEESELAVFGHAVAALLGDAGEGAGLTDVDVQHLLAAIESYSRNAEEEFGTSHDDCRLLGEDDLREYLPVDHLRVRVHTCDSAFDVLARIAAARAVDCHITVSTPHEGEFPIVDALHMITGMWGAAIEFIEESDDELVTAVNDGQVDQLRYADPGRVPLAVRRGMAKTGVYIADAPVLAEGRIELLWYVHEQSISHAYHRYGNLGARSTEERSGVR
jgi:RHH-type proline utilization regulon transcriptional repressor/proline dehydrogenase/delta 1-pyrroline-5-carboxylate dehydrogenase